MKYPLLILLIVVALFSLQGCPGNNPVDDSSNAPKIIGMVVDGSNVPIADADIHYFFGTSKGNSQMSIAADPYPATLIGFSLPARSRVIIDILQFGTKKFIRNLADTTYDAGNYSIRADLSILTNGFYIYRITINGTASERVMTLIQYDLSVLAKTEPLTRTDKSGTFSLPMDVLGIGYWMYHMNGDHASVIDSTVVDSVAIVIIKNDKYTIEGFTVTAAQSITRTFVLK